MHLPPDNSFELPPDNRLVIDAADPIALSDAEVLALLPGWIRRLNSRLRDAWVTAMRKFWLRVQARVGAVLGAVQTPRNAEGLRLEAHGTRLHRPRAPDESQADYRVRLIDRPDTITPNAIRAALTALVLLDTPVAPVAFEPATEGVFVQAEANQDAWLAFVQPVAGPLLWADYPDNDIHAGVWLTAEVDVTRPVFVVFLEGPLYDLPDQPFALPEDSPTPEVDGQFIGTEADVLAFGFVAQAQLSLEARVIREVEARRGAGVVWWLYVLPDLRGAL